MNIKDTTEIIFGYEVNTIAWGVVDKKKRDKYYYDVDNYDKFTEEEEELWYSC